MMTSNLDSLKALVEDPFPPEDYPRAWSLFDEEEYFYFTTNKLATLEHFITDPKCRSISATYLDGYNIGLLLTAKNGAVLYSNRVLLLGKEDKYKIVGLLEEYPKEFAPRSLVERTIKSYLFL